MRVMCGGHFWQFGSIASLAAETTDGEILVAFLTEKCLRSDLRMPNFKKISWGNIPPDPPTSFSLTRTQLLYQL